MGKLKEFITSPKKTTILGLMGAIIMLFTTLKMLDTSYLFLNLYNLYVIGLVIYFSIILMRLYKDKGNLKIANYILIITYILSLIGVVLLSIADGEPISIVLIDILIFGTIILYFCNVLLGKIQLLNNKVFAIVIIGFSVYQLIKFGTLLFGNSEIHIYPTLYCIKYLGYIAIVPYFYNYYELLKEEK